jgi:transcriptional regulator
VERGTVYVDPDYAEPDLDEVFRLVAAHPFATLVTAEPELRIAHVPVQPRPVANNSWEIVAHVAAADPFADSIRRRAEILVSVVGPAVYVSPSWYADRGLPTYNFVAVELRGTCAPLDDPDAVREHLMRLVADHERARAAETDDRWRVDAWARDRTTQLLPDLQAFTMPVEQVMAKVKVSQNRTPADRLGVMAALDRSSRFDDHAVRDLMGARFDESGRARG